MKSLTVPQWAVEMARINCSVAHHEFSCIQCTVIAHALQTTRASALEEAAQDVEARISSGRVHDLPYYIRSLIPKEPPK